MDDEDEMRALRASRLPPPPAPQKKAAQAEDSAELVENPEAAELTKHNLPTSFGAVDGKAKAASKQLLAQTTRAPGPQRAPGPVRAQPPVSPPEGTAIGEDHGFVGPPRPGAVQEEEEAEMVMFEDEETANFYKIPFSNEIKLDGHTRTVSAIGLDPSGSRVLTGGHDYQLKMWDFAGMDSTLRSFRCLEPAEGNPIKSLEFSRTGDRFLVATMNSQAKVYDRDGKQLSECVKGDMYITDMGNTKGHVASLGNALWHPDASQNDTFITSSLDSTVRIWNVEKMQLRGQTSVLKAKSSTGRKTGVTYVTLNHEGSAIVAGCQDGSIQLWPFKGPFNRPRLTIRDAHFPGNDITSLTFSSDGYTLLSRSMDDTLKVWDIRTSKAVATFSDLPTFGDSDCIFSPDEQLIVTGTAVKRGEGTGLLVFYDRKSLQKVKQIGIAPGAGVVSILWHPRINQLFVGTSMGKTHVFFDPQFSQKGALLSAPRAPRQKDPNDYEPPRPILTPHSLPMFYETPNMKRKLARERFDPRKGAKMEIQRDMESGPGKGGRLGSSVTQHLMKHYIRKDDTRDEDPREAILKHAAEAESDPYYFAAYQKTQPKTIFDHSEVPEDPIPKPKPKDHK